MLLDRAEPLNHRLSSQADRCAAELIKRIEKGVLRPNHRLGEESIAREIGIGRAPVRVAFERLVSAGHPAVLLCSPALRPQVRRACELSNLQVAVLAYNEVAQTPVESMGQVTLAETPAASGASS